VEALAVVDVAGGAAVTVVVAVLWVAVSGIKVTGGGGGFFGLGAGVGRFAVVTVITMGDSCCCGP
jgi:hypothetical protein